MRRFLLREQSWRAQVSVPEGPLQGSQVGGGKGLAEGSQSEPCRLPSPGSSVCLNTRQVVPTVVVWGHCVGVTLEGHNPFGVRILFSHSYTKRKSAVRNRTRAPSLPPASNGARKEKCIWGSPVCHRTEQKSDMLSCDGGPGASLGAGEGQRQAWYV